MVYLNKENNLIEKIKNFPFSPGVYLMENKKGKIIYIGKAKNLRKRVLSYFSFSNKHSVKTNFLIKHIDDIKYIVTEDELKAFLLEASLIKEHQPKYNFRLKDDKAYPYIRVSIEDDFPRLYFAHKKENNKSLYFGPYINGFYLKKLINLFNKIFLVRDCKNTSLKNRSRPCMTYQIGNCTAPCVAYINKEEYNKQIKKLLYFLNNKNEEFKDYLHNRMLESSKEEKYELAVKYRDSLKTLQNILDQQIRVSSNNLNQDIIGFYQGQEGIVINMVHIREGKIVAQFPHYFANEVFVVNDELASLANEDDKDDNYDNYYWLSEFLVQFYQKNLFPSEIILPLQFCTLNTNKLESNKLESNNLETNKLKFKTLKFNKLDINLLENFFRINSYEKNKLKEEKDITRSSPIIPKIYFSDNPENQRIVNLANDNAKNFYLQKIEQNHSVEKGLVEIKEKFKFLNLPNRIECFDVSNLGKSAIVASQVVFENGSLNKNQYRKYKIKKALLANDDYASLREVIQRRLKHTEYNEPDLLLIDGGKGHLNIVVKELQRVKKDYIKVASIAKSRRSKKNKTIVRNKQIGNEIDNDSFYLPGRKDPVFFKDNSEGYRILSLLRDEAHRFALTYHRKLRAVQSNIPKI